MSTEKAQAVMGFRIRVKVEMTDNIEYDKYLFSHFIENFRNLYFLHNIVHFKIRIVNE